MHDLNIDDFKSRPPDCACSSSSFIYNPADQVIPGDLDIIINTSLREVFDKGPSIVSLYPSTGKLLWIPSRIMPDNGPSGWRVGGR